MIRQLEQINSQAWPAVQTIDHHGWILQLSDGYSRRANSILTHDSSTGDVEASIHFCERIYGEHGLKTRFRLTDASQPPELETTLVEMGYWKEIPSLVMTMPAKAVDEYHDAEFSFQEAVDQQWLSDYFAMNNIDPQLFDSHMAILNKMSGKVCFGRVGDAALGLAHQTGRYVGLYDIVVDPQYRLQGYGRRIVKSLLAWSGGRDIDTIHLSVQSDNTRAIKLYENLGFQTRYEYYYYSIP